MTDTASARVAAVQPAAGREARIASGAAAFAFGLLVFAATGFAAPSLIHNATHDTRHALGLPCH